MVGKLPCDVSDCKNCKEGHCNIETYPAMDLKLIQGRVFAICTDYQSEQEEE